MSSNKCEESTNTVKLKRIKILYLKVKGYGRGWLYGSMFESNKKVDTKRNNFFDCFGERSGKGLIRYGLSVHFKKLSVSFEHSHLRASRFVYLL
jgi:hypothetical protein